MNGSGLIPGLKVWYLLNKSIRGYFHIILCSRLWHITEIFIVLVTGFTYLWEVFVLTLIFYVFVFIFISYHKELQQTFALRGLLENLLALAPRYLMLDPRVSCSEFKLVSKKINRISFWDYRVLTEDCAEVTNPGSVSRS